MNCNIAWLCVYNCYTHARCVNMRLGPECMLLVPVGREICVQAYKCHLCAECCESLVCRSHICTVRCSIFGAYPGVNSAMLHVPRHGDATRVQCVIYFPERLSIPQVPFPVPGAPPWCLSCVEAAEMYRPALSPSWHCAQEQLGWARAHMVKAVPREMPMAQGPGQAVCGLGMLPPGRWADQGHRTSAKDK